MAECTAASFFLRFRTATAAGDCLAADAARRRLRLLRPPDVPLCLCSGSPAAPLAFRTLVGGRCKRSVLSGSRGERYGGNCEEGTHTSGDSASRGLLILIESSTSTAARTFGLSSGRRSRGVRGAGGGGGSITFRTGLDGGVAAAIFSAASAAALILASTFCCDEAVGLRRVDLRLSRRRLDCPLPLAVLRFGGNAGGVAGVLAGLVDVRPAACLDCLDTVRSKPSLMMMPGNRPGTAGPPRGCALAPPPPGEPREASRTIRWVAHAMASVATRRAQSVAADGAPPRGVLPTAPDVRLLVSRQDIVALVPGVLVRAGGSSRAGSAYPAWAAHSNSDGFLRGGDDTCVVSLLVSRIGEFVEAACARAGSDGVCPVAAACDLATARPILRSSAAWATVERRARRRFASIAAAVASGLVATCFGRANMAGQWPVVCVGVPSSALGITRATEALVGFMNDSIPLAGCIRSRGVRRSATRHPCSMLKRTEERGRRGVRVAGERLARPDVGGDAGAPRRTNAAGLA